MNLNEKFCNLTHVVGNALGRRTPEILAGAGIACFIISTISAVKATPEAAKKLEEKKEELKEEKLTPKETVKTVGKLYLPAVLTGVSGIGFITASVASSNKRYVALSTSYNLLADFAYNYRDKVVETIGAKKDEKIRQEIAQEKLNKETIDENKIIIKSEGTTLFKDSLTGQYFRYDINKFKNKAVEWANAELNEGYIGVPEWLMEFDLSIPDTVLGMGWSLADQGKAMTIDFTANVATNYNDEPCLVINYYPMPISDYNIFYK